MNDYLEQAHDLVDERWEKWWNSQSIEDLFYEFCSENALEIIDFLFEDETLSLKDFKSLVLDEKGGWHDAWDEFLDDQYEIEND